MDLHAIPFVVGFDGSLHPELGHVLLDVHGLLRHPGQCGLVAAVQNAQPGIENVAGKGKKFHYYTNRNSILH